MTKPLGSVTYAGGAVRAELLGVDEWRVTSHGKDDPETAGFFKALYEDTYAGPQHGYYGQLILRDLAERTGGVMEFHPPPPKNVLY